MQLHHIIPPFSLMSQDAQLTFIKAIRHNKYVLKPDVVKKKTKKAAATEASAAKKSKSKTDRLLAGLSPEQKLALLQELENA